jgi:hypothetical protein
MPLATDVESIYMIDKYTGCSNAAAQFQDKLS